MSRASPSLMVPSSFLVKRLNRSLRTRVVLAWGLGHQGVVSQRPSNKLLGLYSLKGLKTSTADGVILGSQHVSFFVRSESDTPTKIQG